uniref:Ionotropic glutamate receptor L-glutamate and glycine-binding domain-containing protein n=1 Tax=Trichogramma kaykai TaxID=54128 RepID=A0ABD2WTK4_9HYME
MKISTGAGLDSVKNIVELYHIFSANGIAAQSIPLRKLSDFSIHYQCPSPAPLQMIVLSSIEDLQIFRNFSNGYPMGRRRWLVIMENSAELLDYCHSPGENNTLNLTFDTEMLVWCENEATINEWYCRANGLVDVHRVANWSLGTGLVQVEQRSLWQRRRSLDGARVRIATVKDTAYDSLTSLATYDGDAARQRQQQQQSAPTLLGLFGQTLRELSDTMNFRVELVASETMYGNYDPATGGWSGVIGLLAQRRIDLGVAEFGRSTDRLEVVDYSSPLVLTRMNLYFEQPTVSAITWSSYAQVLENKIWYASCTLMIVCSVLISFMMTMFRKEGIFSLIVENLFIIWGIQCQQGLPVFPSERSLKLAFFSLFVLFLVINIAYSATLTSYLAVNVPVLPFSNEQEFLENRSYNLTLLRGNLYHDFIVRSPDRFVERIRERLKRVEELPYSMIDAVSQVCTEKVVLYTNEIFVDKIGPLIPCQITAIDTGRLDSAAFTMTKGNPYRRIFDYYLENYRSYGILKVLKSRYLPKREAHRSVYKPVKFTSIVPVLTMFLAGSLLSLTLLALELICHRRARKCCRLRRHELVLS